VSATKGIETDTLDFMHEVLAECLPERPLAVLSGPSFAREVYDGEPTAVVAASEDLRHAETAQDRASGSTPTPT
jgi:glycerol-3-phosphate dehydrogenase (NAD(P)+)